MTETLNWPRSQEPFVPNGSSPKAHKVVAQRNAKDISEKGIDEEVHGFANGMTETLNWPRSQEAFVPNGSSSKAHKNVLMQKTDIANAEVRPDVYTTVKKMINPVPLWRSDKAPKYIYEDWWGEGNPPPRTELPVPPCPTEENDSEPDLAALKAAKFMADEKARDEKMAKAEEKKQDAAIKAAEEEEKKEEAAKKPAAAEKEDAEEKKEEGKEEAKEEGKEEKKEEGKEEKKEEGKEEKKEEKKDAPAADAKTATKTAKATAAPAPPAAAKTATKTATPAATPGKIVKLMTGDLIYDKGNNLWRHEPIFMQQEE